MELCTLSDISNMHGVKINSEDILLPKAYYKEMLRPYPKVVEEVDKFFEKHNRAKAVVIKEFKEV